MNLEHVAFNVADSVAVAKWYCDHLAMKVVRRGSSAAKAHFIADARGKMMLEFYHNAEVKVPDYRAIDSLALHVAFSVEDVRATRERLMKAGAKAEGEPSANKDGDHFAMLRDPWGLAVQLVKRTAPMV
jgi:catechol 2,3-dioxygenase-like lactoylglutathione lyase family enzyme